MSNRQLDEALNDKLRARRGAFYTPLVWAEKGREYITASLGATWQNDCIVWDCAAGTGNLTYGANFTDLLQSSISQEEVDVIESEKTNPNTIAFVYDFLSREPLPQAVEDRLRKAAAAGKRLVFFINPPYAAAGIKGLTGASKTGVATRNPTNKVMADKDLGACRQQLYALFIFRCHEFFEEYGFTKKTLAIFAPTLYMHGFSYRKFTKYLYQHLTFSGGFYFRASHFSGVKANWGISFVVWNEGTQTLNADIDLDALDHDGKTFKSIGTKCIYTDVGRSMADWVRASCKSKEPKEKRPWLTSGLRYKADKHSLSPEDSIINFCSQTNETSHSSEAVFFVSDPSPNNTNYPVLKGRSWDVSIAAFGARKLHPHNWLNDKDHYLEPDTTLPGYQQWLDDVHIYTLIHVSNNTSAMRNIPYSAGTTDTKNNMFWLTRIEVTRIALEHGCYEVAADAKMQGGGEAYFATILPRLNLSPLAQEILDDLNALYRDSMPYREELTHENGLNLHLEAWDAGIYQLQKLWKQVPDLFDRSKELRKKHARLRDQLLPEVYRFGFLKS